jgi:hypothetical protein
MDLRFFNKILIFLLNYLPSIKSMHLNSAVISAKPINETSNGDVYVEFTVRVAFTRDWSGTPSNWP